jgi:hypothetical protein
MECEAGRSLLIIRSWIEELKAGRAGVYVVGELAVERLLAARVNVPDGRRGPDLQAV